MVEFAQEKVIAALKESGGGSLLRGWRVELDPDGSLDVSFLEFCKAASKLRIAVDAEILFGVDSPNELTLDELAPDVGERVYAFRRWMTDKFGGPSEMFTVMEPPQNSDGRLSKQEFVQGCIQHGFEAKEEDMEEIFNLLDSFCVGHVAMEDVMFLDMDPKVREGAIQKVKMKSKIEHEHILTRLHHEVKNMGYQEGHRLAPRNWHAPSIERLPEVVIEKRQQWKEREHKRRSEAIALFRRHANKVYGNGVRAWRKGLDPGSKFVLTRADFLRYCRRLNLEFDAHCCWKILDRDSDGHLRLEEVAPQAAASLARYWKWARETFGSCAATWVHIMKVARPPSSWKSLSSLKYGPFIQALKDLRCPTAETPESGLALCNALDLNGCGIISTTDLKWLDGWQAPEWLYSTPDPDAWKDLSRLLIQQFGKPLKAWRQLDQDDSNNASWEEFEAMCDEVGFEGNRGGAWRMLDTDVSGAITLQEWHPESAELLMSFKTWMDNNWGSVKFAFQMLDTDNSGSVTFSELRRACKRRGWLGSVKPLFECLDIKMIPGERTLSYRDLRFLDHWEPALDEDILDEQPQAEAPTERERRRKTSPRADGSSGRGGATQVGASPAASPSHPGSGKMLRSRSSPAAASAPQLRRPGSSSSAAALPHVPGSPVSATGGGGSRRATPAASGAGRAGAGRPQRGVGCLRNEALESMKKELLRLRGVHDDVSVEHKKFQNKAQHFMSQLPRVGANRRAGAPQAPVERGSGEAAGEAVGEALGGTLAEGGGFAD